MSRTYSNSEHADIVYLYGFYDGNARRENAARFPNRRLPDKLVFSLTFQLKETGSFNMVPWTDGVLASLQNERRRIEFRKEYQSTIKLLLPADMSCRRAFRDWFLNQTDNNSQFSQNILWTVEAIFTRQGILNQRNSHVWSHENPRAIHEQHFQHGFQCNVWLGIMGNILIGPYFLPARLNANGFLAFLNNEFYDGCPAHYGEGPDLWLGLRVHRILHESCDMIITGTIRKNKQGIPAEMKVAAKDFPSSKFCHTRELSLVCFSPKKCKIVLVISFTIKTTSVGEKQKPKMILHYNKTKGRTDALSSYKEEEQKEGEEASETFEPSATLHKYSDRSREPITSTPRAKIVPTIESLENVFETTEDSLATKVQNQLQTSECREALRANLGQKYVEAVLRVAQDKESGIDHVYGVYLHKDGLMFGKDGNKRFDVDDADNIIIAGVRYAGTPDLYELIIKRMPDDALYTEDDMHKYKSMLLMTSAHKHKHYSQCQLLSNRGYKYKYIIAPLMLVTPKKQSKKSGKGLPHAMTLNNNAIDYVHWDDPNELVDRLRLLDASHRAGNNAHDNEMLSIIEELREAGLIIN
ncbi:hypothetical protein ALC57_02255 [Trachymyrmex cornetzi]|uniref:DUF8207 domain-containing protein n=1 Tax=Trachymyrmex cornetzi TaxID=471704 RepID=A0A151JNY1_9HYME|nr:hypothetical protein ALC57_02255 [Trachymyrmex cornetzi]